MFILKSEPLPHRQASLPIYLWLNKIEQIDEGALRQAKNLAHLPFAFHHIAILPDVHVGYGMPIGGILASKDFIVPNAVGVDIGCGVRSIQTNLTVDQIKPILPKILASFAQKIPTGFKHHKKNQESSLFKKAPDIEIIQRELNSARKQIGTLGGGNHFIEIQKDKHGKIWIMLHSGSRNFGLKTASIYHKKAIAWCAKHQINLPDRDLSCLPFNERLGQEYFIAMNFCLSFAKENRKLMMQRIKEMLINFLPDAFEGLSPEALAKGGDFDLDVHHNYASIENHYGQKVIVHRKGAVQAKKSQKTIVPGSMGTPSYICEGLGNELSFESCSHGAGRTMGRREAKRKIQAKKVIQDMKEQGIELYKEKLHDVAEECSDAYKNIDEVLRLEEDLVRPIIKLEPVGVLKA